MAFKRTQPALRFALSENGVSADEMDKLQQYVIGFPSVSATWFGTWAVAGTAAGGALVLINAIADYPRNAEFALAGTGVGMAGTASVTGRDQFGSAFTETFGFGSADNGGTVVGTRIFSQITSGTLSFGTAVGNGTARLGVGTLGTTTLFGLPDRLGGTTDVKAITRSTAPGAQTVNGGTIAAYVNVPRSAVQSPATLAGSMIISVLYKPSFVTESQVVNIPQRT